MLAIPRRRDVPAGTYCLVMPEGGNELGHGATAIAEDDRLDATSAQGTRANSIGPQSSLHLNSFTAAMKKIAVSTATTATSTSAPATFSYTMTLFSPSMM